MMTGWPGRRGAAEIVAGERLGEPVALEPWLAVLHRDLAGAEIHGGRADEAGDEAVGGR